MEHYSSNELKRFNYLFGETESVYHEVSLKLGLSDSAMKILYVLCDNEESCPLQTICRYSGLSKQTVNSAIRKLENEGILYLENAGKKTKNACLTDFGKSFARKTALRIIEMENSIFSSWEKEDVAAYLKLTEQFLNDLRKKTEEL